LVLIFQDKRVWLIFEAQQTASFIKACPCRGALMVMAGVARRWRAVANDSGSALPLGT
jgi:hypothetical protein